jgi:hypothetical protein
MGFPIGTDRDFCGEYEKLNISALSVISAGLKKQKSLDLLKAFLY